MIPGAEFASLIAVDSNGPRSPTLAEVQEYCEGYRENGRALQAVGSPDVACYVRRLSCTNPDDQRAIWRLAAIEMGATSEESVTTTIRYLGGALLELYTTNDLGECVLRRWTGTMDRLAEATACLCAFVWGSK